MMYEMRRRKAYICKPFSESLESVLKGSLTSHTICAWYEINWDLMMLYVIHSREIDFSTAKCYVPSPQGH